MKPTQLTVDGRQEPLKTVLPAPQHEAPPLFEAPQTMHGQMPLDDPLLCQWFALCQRHETATEPHPVLGDVPICDECATLVAKLSEPRHAAD